METIAVRELISKQLESARDRYVSDLDAIDEPLLGKSPGGVARSPYDFTYEVAYVNRKIAKRLRGEIPEVVDMQGWIKAPEDFREKAVAMESFKSSTDEVIAAWNAIPENELTKKIELPSGESTPFNMATLCLGHIVYHDAQLNYLQSLTGDDEMHWD